MVFSWSVAFLSNIVTGGVIAQSPGLGRESLDAAPLTPFLASGRV